MTYTDNYHHMHGLAQTSFGVRMLCWVLIGSTILNRLFFHSSVPAIRSAPFQTRR